MRRPLSRQVVSRWRTLKPWDPLLRTNASISKRVRRLSLLIVGTMIFVAGCLQIASLLGGFPDPITRDRWGRALPRDERPPPVRTASGLCNMVLGCGLLYLWRDNKRD